MSIYSPPKPSNKPLKVLKDSLWLCVQEKTVEVNDWRKNVEAMSGMEGRKKMFDAGPSQ